MVYSEKDGAEVAKPYIEHFMQIAFWNKQQQLKKITCFSFLNN